jgi:hypothetical protein
MCHRAQMKRRSAMFSLKILGPARHVFRIEAVAHQAECTDEIANCSDTCCTKRNTSMLVANAHQTQEIRIVSHHNSPLAPSEFKMGFIRCAQEASVRAGRDIDTAIP